MEMIPTFKKGERVRLEYVVDGKFMKDDEIYYTLKNASNQTILKGVAFKAEELIPVEVEVDVNVKQEKKTKKEETKAE